MDRNKISCNLCNQWASLRSDMSWRRTEYSKNTLTWEDADDAMRILEQHR